MAGLATAVASIRRLRPAPDALIITGDIADTRADSEYAHVLGASDDVDAPSYPLPGNHDDRDGLRRHFGIPGEPGTPVQYAVELGALRILMLAMHHPPLLTHVPAMDALALAAEDQVALADVVARHPNVTLIVAGHVHRAISGELAGRRVLSAPSTYIGFELDLVAEQIDDVPTPPGYVVHVLRDGQLASHVVALRG